LLCFDGYIHSIMYTHNGMDPIITNLKY
jgi:hypothetical protein